MNDTELNDALAFIEQRKKMINEYMSDQINYYLMATAAVFLLLFVTESGSFLSHLAYMLCPIVLMANLFGAYKYMIERNNIIKALFIGKAETDEEKARRLNAVKYVQLWRDEAKDSIEKDRNDKSSLKSDKFKKDFILFRFFALLGDLVLKLFLLIYLGIKTAYVEFKYAYRMNSLTGPEGEEFKDIPNK